MSRLFIFVFAPFFIVCVSFYFYSNFFLSPLEKIVPVEWKSFVNSSTNPAGYLVTLQNESKNIFAYIAVDKELSHEMYEIGEGWKIEDVAHGETWNPRVCAKMPIMITPVGDIYMYDTERQSSGAFFASLIHYSRAQSLLLETDFNYGNFTGKLFFATPRSEPYFILERDNALYRYVIESASVKETKLVKLTKNQTATIAVSKGRTPIFKIYDDGTMLTSEYVLQGDKLISFDGKVLESQVRHEEDTYAIYNIQNGFEAKYKLDRPYETEVLYQKESILRFNPESKVYAYIVGSFNLK